MSLIDTFAIHVVPRMYRGKGTLHPSETGRLMDRVSCVREYDINIFFIRRGETLIAIDAGYKDHSGLQPGCRKIGVDPALMATPMISSITDMVSSVIFLFTASIVLGIAL